MQQGEEQQLPSSNHYNREEEYSAARRAGSEAILTGRETLEAATRQGEQLENAERMADETGYKLDRAGRVLRGMTWSGWVANMFAKELKTPTTEEEEEEEEEQRKNALIPSVYENAPPKCRAAAQAVQNYHANLKVLNTCETDEQLETCQIICYKMYDVAHKEIEKVQSELEVDEQTEDDHKFLRRIKSDLDSLRSRQDIKRRLQQRRQREKQQETDYQEKREALNLPENADRQDPRLAQFPNASAEQQTILQQQNEHLDGVSEQLDELGNLAISLGEITDRHGHIVESLDNKSDSILEKTRMVTRRADRLIQKKAWSPAKAVFHSFVTIRHLRTNKYLGVSNGSIELRDYMDYETCVFGLWKRQGDIIGLQNKFNRRWVGQNVLGNLECNAHSFGRRQEWEVDKCWENTPLLCASAGWGAGSYVVVTGKEHLSINIAMTGTVTARTADMFCVKEVSSR